MKEIPVVLETLSATRIGSSGVYFDYSAADIMTYKLPLQVDTNLYYIPAIAATSFKGVLRSTYERYVRRYTQGNSINIGEVDEFRKNDNHDGAVKSRVLKNLLDEVFMELKLAYHAGLTGGEASKLIAEGPSEDKLKEYLNLYFEITGRNAAGSCYVTSDLDRCENLQLLEDREKSALKELWGRITGRPQGLCETCRIFGTLGVRGYVKFTDLIAVDPFPVLLERLTHVAINRLTGASEKHKLFTEEVIPAGVKFLGFVVVLDDSKLSSVINALKVLKEKAETGEVWIGGRGTSGYGSFRLHFEDEVELSGELFGGSVKIKLGPRNVRLVDHNGGLLGKLFPPGLVGSLTEDQEALRYVVVTESESREFTDYQELHNFLEQLRREGKKYRVEARGVLEL